MALYDISQDSSWTSKLCDILRPAPHPLMVKFSNSQSRFRHSPGDFWRHALSSSVYYDLAGNSTSFRSISLSGRDDLDQDSSSAVAATSRTWRRFVRVEHVGLSGLLFYEIGLPYFCDGAQDQGGDSDLSSLTLESVFGDPDNPTDPGMGVDDLLDAVHAKVVYFPAYACTSFITGQAMTAFFRERPSLRPRPDRDGFSVLSLRFHEDIPRLTYSEPRNSAEPGSAIDDNLDVDGDSLSSFSSTSLDMVEDLLQHGDPHLALFVRSSTLPQSASRGSGFLEREDDKDEGNSTASSLDFTGPSTPSSILTAGLHSPASCGALELGLPPFFVSGGSFRLSVYDDLTSFLDLSASDLEDGEWAEYEEEIQRVWVS